MRTTGVVLGIVMVITVNEAGHGGNQRDVRASANERDADSGREIYVNTCIPCHGIDGKGASGIQLLPKPADLTTPAVQRRTDVSLFKRIHDGKPNTAMGAWSYALSDDEIWDVLAYVRTLRSE
ncbi:MAG TPA: cytochrome c [Nitrospira sp.]|nr:cytochrome c [Nitrospira sp.]